MCEKGDEITRFDGMPFRWPITKAYLDMAKKKFRSVDEYRMYPAMSMHTRQELDLKIGVSSAGS